MATTIEFYFYQKNPCGTKQMRVKICIGIYWGPSMVKVVHWKKFNIEVFASLEFWYIILEVQWSVCFIQPPFWQDIGFHSSLQITILAQVYFASSLYWEEDPIQYSVHLIIIVKIDLKFKLCFWHT